LLAVVTFFATFADGAPLVVVDLEDFFLVVFVVAVVVFLAVVPVAADFDAAVWAGVALEAAGALGCALCAQSAPDAITTIHHPVRSFMSPSYFFPVGFLPGAVAGVGAASWL
jgi:hypothetical protein